MEEESEEEVCFVKSEFITWWERCLNLEAEIEYCNYGVRISLGLIPDFVYTMIFVLNKFCDLQWWTIWPQKLQSNTIQPFTK